MNCPKCNKPMRRVKPTMKKVERYRCSNPDCEQILPVDKQKVIA